MDQRINALVRQVYDAALAPERWPAALESFGEALGGAALVMSALHRTRGMLIGVATGQDPAAAQELRSRFNCRRSNPLVAAVSDLPVGAATVRQAIHRDELYLRGALYNEIFRPQGLKHRVIACLHRSAALLCPLGILRPGRAEDFSPAQMRLIGLMVPHLSCAIEISTRFAALEDSLADATSALDRVALGIFVTDPRGAVVRLNYAAEALVREQDALALRSGELQALRNGDAAVLRSAIARALANPREAPGAVRLQRRSGKRPYLALVAPLGARAAAELAQARGGAIVVVSDPAASPAGRRRLLRQLFKLSAREAQLAEALLEGKRLEDYAAEAGVSMSTARSQLRSVFSKTDTARQAELAPLLNGIASFDSR